MCLLMIGSDDANLQFCYTRKDVQAAANHIAEQGRSRGDLFIVSREQKAAYDIVTNARSRNSRNRYQQIGRGGQNSSGPRPWRYVKASLK